MSLILQQLKCSACGAPLKSKERDRMLVCGHCGTLSLFAEGKMNAVEFSIAKPNTEGKDPVVYIPFWLVEAEVKVLHEKISGGGISRMVTGKKQMRGKQTFYICAVDSMP